MPSYRVISSDSHVTEPEDTWTGRVESKYQDRVPRYERSEEHLGWVCDGKKLGAGGASKDVGLRFEAPEKLALGGTTIEEARLGGFIPEEHVKDMDIDGIDIGLLYPTLGVTLYSTPDSEVLTATCQGYNDWLAEFCSADPRRLKGIAMLNVDDVSVGVRELELCAKKGLVGAMIAVYPIPGQFYDQPQYEPLWAAAQDLGMPLSLHAATNRSGGPLQEFANLGTTRPAFLSMMSHWAAMSLADIIFCGAFERYPKLQVGSVEHELSWVPHFLDRIDYTYTQRAMDFSPYRFKGDVLPSDFFHSNCFLGFQEDGLGIRDRHIIGVDNLQWGSDYPHQESTFPRSMEILEGILMGCTEEEKAKIAGGNVARVYNLE